MGLSPPKSPSLSAKWLFQGKTRQRYLGMLNITDSASAVLFTIQEQNTRAEVRLWQTLTVVLADFL